MSKYAKVAGVALGAGMALAAGESGAADTGPAQEERLEEIIVTGSLIRDPNRESPSPIVITSIEDLQQSGTITLEAALNQMPQFAPSGSAGNTSGNTAFRATELKSRPKASPDDLTVGLHVASPAAPFANRASAPCARADGAERPPWPAGLA